MEATRQHIVKSFDQELKTLDNQLLKMFNILSQKLDDSVNAIKSGDSDRLAEIVGSDSEINKLDYKNNIYCIDIISLRQPMGSDLRMVFSAIHISRNLERIGDSICKVAKIFSNLNSQTVKHEDIISKTLEMMEMLLHTLNSVKDAYARISKTKSIEIMKNDDAIDSIYRDLVKKVISLVQEEHVKEVSEDLLDFMLCIKTLERIGDYAVNIAYYIYYMKTAQFFDKTTL